MIALNVKTRKTIKLLEMNYVVNSIDTNSVPLNLKCFEMFVGIEVFYFANKIVRKVQRVEFFQLIQIFNLFDNILL